MTRITKTQKLLDLREKHPDWNYRQYAEYLGQSHETVRSIISRLGLSGKRGRPRNEDRDKLHVKKNKKKPMPEPPQHRVFSKAGPRSHGYTKLM